MKAIADAIRGKTGKDELILPADMPVEIDGIKVGDDKWKQLAEIIVGRKNSKVSIDLTGLDIISISEYAFSNLPNMDSILIPNNVTNIGEYAFFNCISLHSILLPNELENIYSCAFYNTGITEISIPNKVHLISSYVFRYNLHLTSVTFEGTPTSIAADVFDVCRSLKTINVPWSEGDVANAPWGATNVTINYNYK